MGYPPGGCLLVCGRIVGCRIHVLCSFHIIKELRKIKLGVYWD